MPSRSFTVGVRALIPTMLFIQDHDFSVAKNLADEHPNQVKEMPEFLQRLRDKGKSHP